MSEYGMEYPHNVLEGFGNGCITDFRMRFAMDLLKGMDIDGNPGMVAAQALAVSAELFSQAEKLGWVTPLPDTEELDDAVRLQAKRTAQFQVLQQIEGNKFAQSEASRVQKVNTPVTINH